MWKCPECNEIIEHLQYSVPLSQTEYGTATLNDEQRPEIDPARPNLGLYYEKITEHEADDNSDSSWDGDCEYRCPECDHNTDLDELIWVGKKEIKKKLPEEPEETLHNIIKPEKYIIKDEISKDITDSSLICKKCRHLFIYDTDDSFHNNHKEFYECPKCGQQNSEEEFRELFKKGFFNKSIKNKNDTKKIKYKSRTLMGKSKPKIHFKISKYQ